MTTENAEPSIESAVVPDSASAFAMPLTALLNARQSLETVLARHENWRALRNIEDHAPTGDAEAAQARNSRRAELIKPLLSEPEFLAWQLVETAIACLDTGMTLGTSELPTAGEPSKTPLVNISPDQMQRPQEVQTQYTPTGRLARRIPTLLPHDGREPRPTPALSTGPAGGSANERSLFDDSSAPATFGLPPTAVEEAEVRIIVHRPPTPLITPNLPPLPLTPRSVTRPPVSTRASPAAPSRSCDQPRDDASLHALPAPQSAFEEAQVTILASLADSRKT